MLSDLIVIDWKWKFPIQLYMLNQSQDVYFYIYTPVNRCTTMPTEALLSYTLECMWALQWVGVGWRAVWMVYCRDGAVCYWQSSGSWDHGGAWSGQGEACSLDGKGDRSKYRALGHTLVDWGGGWLETVMVASVSFFCLLLLLQRPRYWIELTIFC